MSPQFANADGEGEQNQTKFAMEEDVGEWGRKSGSRREDARLTVERSDLVCLQRVNTCAPWLVSSDGSSASVCVESHRH